MIIRRRHTANFTTIGNVLFEDERLALDELGLVAWLRSKPHDWEIRRPALMRRFKIGRDGLRRIMRALIRYGWIGAVVNRSQETGRVYVIYEVRDEPGPELSEDEARKALSLVSSGAGPGESTDDDGEGEDPDVPEGADPPDKGATGYGSPPTGEPEAARRLRQSPPGLYKNLQNTDSENTESPKGVRAFSRVMDGWPAENILSRVTAETALAALTDKDFADCEAGMKPYLADCKAEGRKVCDLRTFIVERRWERFAAKAQTQTLFVVKRGTPESWRWREYLERAEPDKLKVFDMMLERGGYTAPTQWPPSLPPKEPQGDPPDKREAVLSAQDMNDFK